MLVRGGRARFSWQKHLKLFSKPQIHRVSPEVFGKANTENDKLIGCTHLAISGLEVRWWRFFPTNALWGVLGFWRKCRYFTSKCSQIVRKWFYEATKTLSERWRSQLLVREISSGNTLEISTTWAQHVNYVDRGPNAKQQQHSQIVYCAQVVEISGVLPMEISWIKTGSWKIGSSLKWVPSKPLKASIANLS